MPPDDLVKSHRWFAVECNNRAWALAAQPARTAAEDRELLLAAYAAAFHWSKAGTPLNHMRADLLLARVHALLGQPTEALRYARSVLQFCESNPCEDWDLAFAHAELAFAAHKNDDAALHRQHYEKACELGPAIQDAEDREVFLAEFARLPAPKN